MGSSSSNGNELKNFQHKEKRDKQSFSSNPVIFDKIIVYFE